MRDAEPTSLIYELPDVAETALATLWSRGLESLSVAPILNDPKAVELMRKLRPLLGQGSPLARSLSRDEVESSMQTYVALRSRRMDAYAREHLGRYPDGEVVNLGCGLDTRKWRIDSGQVVELDLPEMSELRRALLGDRSIGVNVLDDSWFGSIKSELKGPPIFLAEGLFMYLEKSALRGLIGKLADTFPGSILAAEVFDSFWLGERRSKHIKSRLAEVLLFGKNADFVSGLDSPSEMEQWAADIRFLDEWSFLDEAEAKLGRLAKLKHFPRFRQRQTIVRYRLGVHC